jgi:hypothetical protein
MVVIVDVAALVADVEDGVDHFVVAAVVEVAVATLVMVMMNDHAVAAVVDYH